MSFIVYLAVIIRISIAVIKDHDQKQLVKERVSVILALRVITQESQGRNSRQAPGSGTDAKTTE